MVPDDSTTYWCKGFNMPAIGKHHMIKVNFFFIYVCNLF